MEDHDCLIQLGNKSTIESAQLACTEPFSSIVIGNDCMFSNEIELRTGDSHSIIDLNTQQRINYAKNIKIEDRVWIGAHSKILKGAEIKSDVIVGIGSIVLGNIPLKNNSIYSGIPAKCVKEGIIWSRARILKSSEK
jgi:acetyltransferase-like isoleucine patch superfamily enzyme